MSFKYELSIFEIETNDKIAENLKDTGKLHDII